MTHAQHDKIWTLALRWGCAPDDIVTEARGDDLVVTMGTAKGRPKTVTITPGGRVRTRGENDA